MAAYGKVQLQQSTEDSVSNTAKAGAATRRASLRVAQSQKQPLELVALFAVIGDI